MWSRSGHPEISRCSKTTCGLLSSTAAAEFSLREKQRWRAGCPWAMAMQVIANGGRSVGAAASIPSHPTSRTPGAVGPCLPSRKSMASFPMALAACTTRPCLLTSPAAARSAVFRPPPSPSTVELHLPPFWLPYRAQLNALRPKRPWVHGSVLSSHRLALPLSTPPAAVSFRRSRSSPHRQPAFIHTIEHRYPGVQLR